MTNTRCVRAQALIELSMDALPVIVEHQRKIRAHGIGMAKRGLPKFTVHFPPQSKARSARVTAVLVTLD